MFGGKRTNSLERLDNYLFISPELGPSLINSDKKAVIFFC